MISTQLILALIIGAVLMLVPLMIQAKWYNIKLWKCFIITGVLTVVGTIGTYLLYFIENFKFGGISFYGAVFFVPIAFLLFYKLINIEYGKLMSLCAPAECVMLALMKVRCYTTGCCAGRELFVTADGVSVVFPSQLVELVVALVICVVLMVISKKKDTTDIIYPIYLVIYGSSRFVLNLLRKPMGKILILPIGNIWSLVAIAIGVMWLVVYNRTKKQECQTNTKVL